MDGTSRQSNSGRTLEVAGTWGEGKVVVVTLFFFLWWKGENGMGERRWAGATESYRPMFLKAGSCKSVMVEGSS
jgi:hypothetical protein